MRLGTRRKPNGGTCRIKGARPLAIARTENRGGIGPMIPNYKLAAYVAQNRGVAWLRGASPKDMSEATDEALRFLGKSQDTRQAVTCLRALREYVVNTGKLT
jgi:hypothetical protein